MKRKIRTSTSLVVIIAVIMEYARSFNLRKRDLQTLDTDEKNCKELDEVSKKIMLHHKYSTCYLQLTRTNQKLKYYECLDRSLDECGMGKRYVHSYKMEENSEKNSNNTSNFVNNSPNLHSCNKGCVKLSYKICGENFSPKNPQGYSSCIQSKLKTCKHLCFEKHSTGTDMKRFENLTDDCSKSKAKNMISRCRVEAFAGDENKEKRTACIETLAYYAETVCMNKLEKKYNISVVEKNYTSCYESAVEPCFKQFMLDFNLTRFKLCSDEKNRYCEHSNPDRESLEKNKKDALANAKLDCYKKHEAAEVKKCTDMFVSTKDIERFWICQTSLDAKLKSMCLDAEIEKIHEFSILTEAGKCIRKNWEYVKALQNTSNETYVKSANFLEGHCRLYEKNVIVAEDNDLIGKRCVIECFNRTFQNCYLGGRDSYGHNNYNACMTLHNDNCTKFCHAPKEREPLTPEANTFLQTHVVGCEKLGAKGTPNWVACAENVIKHSSYRYPSPCCKYCLDKQLFDLDTCAKSYPAETMARQLMLCRVGKLDNCRKERCSRIYVYEKSKIKPNISSDPVIAQCQNTYTPYVLHYSKNKYISILIDKYSGILYYCQTKKSQAASTNTQVQCFLKNGPACLKYDTPNMKGCFSYIYGTYCKPKTQRRVLEATTIMPFKDTDVPKALNFVVEHLASSLLKDDKFACLLNQMLKKLKDCNLDPQDCFDDAFNDGFISCPSLLSESDSMIAAHHCFIDAMLNNHKFDQRESYSRCYLDNI